MFHSWNSPAMRVKIKISEIKVHTWEEIIVVMMGRGSKIAISTSKIKKMMATIKNRRENGIREPEKGENPHSNGEVFSRSRSAFFPRRLAVRIIANAMTKMMVIRFIKTKISFPG